MNSDFFGVESFEQHTHIPDRPVVICEWGWKDNPVPPRFKSWGGGRCLVSGILKKQPFTSFL